MEVKTGENLRGFLLRFTAVMGMFAAIVWLAGCNNSEQQSDEQLRQQAAQATQQAKAGAQQAAADAKVAAANAERKINDVAAGVKDGLKSTTKPGAGLVNINTATEDQLVDLPGITGARAQRIMRGRPYGSPQELVSKGILTNEQFSRISGQVVAN